MEHAAVYQKTTNPVLQFKARIEKGLLVPDLDLSALSGQSYIVTLVPDVAEGPDALEAILALAQPIGPADLARNFDTYTGRTVIHETAEPGLR